MNLLWCQTIASRGLALSALLASGQGDALAQAVNPLTVTVATPTFAPNSGTYTSAKSIAITDATTGSSIYYTINGATPTPASTQYTGPITVSHSETLKAIATLSGDASSAVGSATYTIEVATPTFAPKPGTYTSDQTVSLADATPNSTIYYTTNGAAPTTASAKYTGPITVSHSETLKAIATLSGDTSSAVGSATYTIDVATPTFSPAAGTYQQAQSVKIADSTPSASIYYTTNGATPTTASTKYTMPISVGTSETLKAIAIASGDSNSPVATATYDILIAATPTFSVTAGLYNSIQKVTISDKTPDATIYYTTDGSVPTTASTKYTSAITVETTETVRAIATATGYTTSAVATAAYQVILETVLYAFDYATGSIDGNEPVSPVTQGTDGNFYGTTYGGGAYAATGSGAGTVFKMTPTGVKTTLYSFGATATALYEPNAPLVEGKDGNFYGTALGGGAYGGGGVFKITAEGDETVIYSFGEAGTDGLIFDGADPVGLMLGKDGNFYGMTTQGGGTSDCYGTLFKMTASGIVTVLNCFPFEAQPVGNLVEASDGNFYGATSQGGTYGGGTVFKITPMGELTVLYSFTGGPNGIAGSTDGYSPFEGLVQATDGNLYGTTYRGGVGGYGTVFRVTLAGHETVLYSFDTSTNTSADGAYPSATLIQGSDGNLYGSTEDGGINGYGTVFRISLSGTETVLFGFDSANGALPLAGVIEAPNGDLYGTTSGGGPAGNLFNGGVVFKLTGAISAESSP